SYLAMNRTATMKSSIDHSELPGNSGNVIGAAELDVARRYCRSLARGHYENFVVGSILIPRVYTQHLFNIYAFCRNSDDIADEVGDANRSLELLSDWRDDLKRCYGGRPTQQTMIALQDTISTFDIPIKPFEDLISAFEQDCRVSRYETYEELLSYSERSANPVGRLFLWIFGYKDEERLGLSDNICTALQLANFWQDVSEDYRRGRVYIPRQDLQQFGCDESTIAEGRITPAFRDMMRFEVARTQELLDIGAALPLMLDGRVRIDVELFRRGGMAVLEEIRRIEYSVIERRPRVSKFRQALLFLSCIMGRCGK
ncbi:MAG TPA: squalene synthase HpnC, partial [Armatimonadota bacterium]